jgi:DNA-binding transcriptional MerR regulator
MDNIAHNVSIPLRHSISDAARLLGISTKSLRRWEALGKISPPRRDRNGHRFYSGEDVELIRKWMDSETPHERIA